MRREEQLQLLFSTGRKKTKLRTDRREKKRKALSIGINIMSTNNSRDYDRKMSLWSLPYYDDLRLNRTRSGGGGGYTLRRDEDWKIDWLKPNEESLQDEGDVAICHVGSFTSVTIGPYVSISGFEEVTALALAAHHLNTGDGRVVSEIEGINERCPIRFTTEFLDNNFDQKKGVKNILDLMVRPAESSETRRPCATVGARAGSLTTNTALVSSVFGTVQMGGSAGSITLDDPDLYPLFGRILPSGSGLMLPMIRLMYEEWNVKHLVVVNSNEIGYNSQIEFLRIVASELTNGEMEIVQIPLDQDRGSISQAVADVKRLGFRYVFALLHSNAFHDAVMLEALHQGVAGNGEHTWMFGSGAVDLLNRPLPKNSDLRSAYRGTGYFSSRTYEVGDGSTPPDQFLKRWSEFIGSQEDSDYLNTLFPHNQHAGQSWYETGIVRVKNGDFLKDVTVLDDSGRSEGIYYDTMIAIGLGACDAYEKHGRNFTGQQHFESIVDNVFEGVTGTVKLDSISGSRDPSTYRYQAVNFLEHEYNDTEVIYMAERSFLFSSGRWSHENDWVFSSGTTVIPADIPTLVVNDNAISVGVRGTVLALCAVAICMGLYFSFWTHRNRKTYVVGASQPFFLHTIAFGCIVLSCAIIPLTFDLAVASSDGCSIACTSTLWLVCFGFSITFSALFTKNYRINKLFKSAAKMKRIKVTILDVAIPMVCLLTGTLRCVTVTATTSGRSHSSSCCHWKVNALVLSLMTTLAPIHFVTEVERYDEYGRAEETISQCGYNEGQAPYLATLAIINTACLLFAIFQAWQARHLSTEFGESRHVFIALLSTLLVALVGIPVILLARENKNASTFVTSAIIFVACASVQLTMFLPKLRHIQENGDRRDLFRLALNNAASRRTTGGGTHHETSCEGGVLISGLFTSSTGTGTAFTSGIQVLGSKSKDELLLENESLKSEIARLRGEHYLAVLSSGSEKSGACRCNSGDSLPESATNQSCVPPAMEE